jgi:hypothetical protein
MRLEKRRDCGGRGRNLAHIESARSATASKACYRLGVTILKQLAFSIAFAVAAVAVAEYVMWAFGQGGGISP